MTASTHWISRTAIPLLTLTVVSCGDPAPESAAPPPPAGASSGGAVPESAGTTPGVSGPRPLTAEEQKQVIEEVIQVRAKQQAEGLGSGSVTVNAAWPYTGYSTLSPDPSAAIEARLVAVDVTVSGHTPYFDIDDIEIVDGESLVSYGSDPHAEPLGPDGALLPAGEAIAAGPAPSRWLLIFAFPKATPRFHLYYWGKALTPEAVGFGTGGLSLPYPPAD
jgi:hypothetical protein